MFKSCCSTRILNLATLVKTQQPDDVSPLGRSLGSTVDRVSYHRGRYVFARKLVYAPYAAKSGLEEAKILQSLHHPNVVRYLAHFRDRDHLYILMYPAAETDLSRFMKNENSEQTHCWNWFRDLASGLRHIHSLAFRHGDIKPSNILVHKNQVLLADFGLSKPVRKGGRDDLQWGYCTRRYAAPEMWSGHRGQPSDIWALGCVYLELLVFILRCSTRAFLVLDGLDESDQDWTYGNQLKTVQSLISSIDFAADDVLRDAKPSADRRQLAAVVVHACKVMLQSNPSSRPSAGALLSIFHSQHSISSTKTSSGLLRAIHCDIFSLSSILTSQLALYLANDGSQLGNMDFKPPHWIATMEAPMTSLWKLWYLHPLRLLSALGSSISTSATSKDFVEKSESKLEGRGHVTGNFKNSNYSTNLQLSWWISEVEPRRLFHLKIEHQTNSIRRLARPLPTGVLQCTFLF